MLTWVRILLDIHPIYIYILDLMIAAYTCFKQDIWGEYSGIWGRELTGNCAMGVFFSISRGLR